MDVEVAFDVTIAIFGKKTKHNSFPTLIDNKRENGFMIYITLHAPYRRDHQDVVIGRLSNSLFLILDK